MQSAEPSWTTMRRYDTLDQRIGHTFVMTAMDAYEFPKLIPTTVGMEGTSMGASAVPLGCEAIFENTGRGREGW